MRLLRHRSRHPVGVDIRSNEIRIVRLNRLSRRCFRLDYAEIGRLEVGQSVSHPRMDWAGLKNLMGRMVREGQLEGQPVVVSLPASGVKMQRIHLPTNLQTYAIEAAIQGRLRQDMPGLAETICVDYVSMPSDGINKNDVFFVAARQALLADYVDCVASAGLEVKIVDVDIYSMCRALHYQAEESLLRHKVYALLIILNDTAEFVVCDNQTIIFHQTECINSTFSADVMLTAQLKKFRSYAPHLSLRSVMTTGHLEWGYDVDIYCVDPREIFKATPKTQLLLHTCSTELLTACGAAMRELPAWC